MPLTPEQRRQNRIDAVTRRFQGRYKWRAIKEVATAFQELRRLQEANEHGYVQCVTCDDAYGIWNQGFQGGHFVSRRSHATIYDPRNVNVQCENCNGQGEKNGLVSTRYRLWMIDTHSLEVVEELESKRNQHVEFSWDELATKLVDFQALIKTEKKRIGA